MAVGVRNLVFLFDNPLGQIVDRAQLAAVGGFFFRRAGAPVAVETPAVGPGEDPNNLLLAAANRRPQSGILWLYDLNVRGTVAALHPVAIEQRDPAWRCRQFGRDEIGVVACIRHAGPAAAGRANRFAILAIS